MSTHTHRRQCVSVLWNLSVWHAQFIRTLSPESPGPPGGPEAPGGPGRPYFKQDLILHTSYINNATHTKKKERKSHICSTDVLSVPLQSGHTWEKGMHEAIWDSLLSCKSFERHFLFVHSSMLEWLDSVGLHLQGVKSNCVWLLFIDTVNKLIVLTSGRVHISSGDLLWTLHLQH